jgi:proline iminopeptidase
LTLGDGQGLAWEESGNPAGIPALFLHGGPGSGLGQRGYVQSFDPVRYRVIGFDQRGCGRSWPLATDPAHDLSANTTPRLIADIEELRAHLGIASWLVSGVSWGTTLALAYALAHPARVRGLILVAVTTTSRREVDWITEGVGAVFPEAWDRLASHAEHAGIGYQRGGGRLVEAYRRLLVGSDPAVRAAAAAEWMLWEATHVSLAAGGVHADPRPPEAQQVCATLVTHYWSHDGFCQPPILQRVGEIAHLPAVLIHGRSDISSPALTAWELQRRWPGSELIVDAGSGHGSTAMAEIWCSATDRFAQERPAEGPETGPGEGAQV